MEKLNYKENWCDFYCGNHLEKLALIENESVDFIITSPPYGQMRNYEGYEYNNEKLVPELFRVLKVGGRVAWIVRDQIENFDMNGQSFIEWFEFKKYFKANDVLIYGKKTMSQAYQINTKTYARNIENIFIFSKDKPIIFNPIIDRRNTLSYIKSTNHIKKKKRTKEGIFVLSNQDLTAKKFGVRHQIWMYSTGSNHSDTDNDNKNYKEHPAYFPLQLAVDLIQSFSNEGNIILDPMGGSGTSAKAALLLNRNSIYIDCSERYYQLAKERFLHSTEKLLNKDKQKKLEDFV